MIPHCTTFSFCSSVNSENASATSPNISDAFSITGTNAAPKRTPSFRSSFNAPFNCSAGVASIFSNAFCVAPALVSIPRSISLYSSPLFLYSTNAADPASTEPNISFKVLSFFCASAFNRLKISVVDVPSFFRSAKPFPVSSRSVMSAILPLFDNSDNIAFKYVPDSAVATPFFVSCA